MMRQTESRGAGAGPFLRPWGGTPVPRATPRSPIPAAVVLLAAMFAGSVPGQSVKVAIPAPLEACRDLRQHGKRAEAQACFTTLSRNADPFLAAEGEWGLENYDEANRLFRAASQQHPGSPLISTEWGMLFLERFNRTEAENLFKEALDADLHYAPAHLGLARVAAERYDKEAVDFARAAASEDPHLAAAHELLAYLALEDDDAKTAALEAHRALDISTEALDALAVLASIDWLRGDVTSATLNAPLSNEWAARILKINPSYGAAFTTGGHFLEINRRYAEAVALYRKAVELDATYWPARSELGLNLMRLGDTKEAKQQLEEAYQHHYRNAETSNSLQVLDSLDGFESTHTPTLELFLDKKEADLLRPYFLEQAQRAVADYQRKYKYTLPGPVRLEVYPNHEDFIVRTLGLPGQGGLLGVTFGLVVAMDSPSAREPGAFHWAATLRHEFSHVFVLSMTQNRVPRWFTEGLAVHEEGAASPDWGDRLTPDVIDAIAKQRLLPVLDLDRGFVRPEYPSQVIVSYYQAGQICDYISSRFGDDALLGMIHSYASRKTTAEAIVDNLHQTPEAFDKDFRAWLDSRTGETVKHFAEWKKGIEEARASLKANRPDEAITEARAVRDLYPDYVDDSSAYELLAQAYTDKGDQRAALVELQAAASRGLRRPSLLKLAAKTEQSLGDTPDAITFLKRINLFYLEDEEVHRKLGALDLESGQTDAAIVEFKAALALKPVDLAQSHFNLASAFARAGRAADARNEVLLALEIAPNFKPAQHLLLQLTQ
jgi:cellulose synthase operon protein C